MKTPAACQDCHFAIPLPVMLRGKMHVVPMCAFTASVKLQYAMLKNLESASDQGIIVP